MKAFSNKKKLLIAFVLVIALGLFFKGQHFFSVIFDVETRIAKAVVDGDVEKFDQIVAAYPDVDYAGFRYKRDNNLTRFLGYKTSSPLLIERLMTLGLDFGAIDVDGRTLLHHVVDGNNATVADELLRNGADIHRKRLANVAELIPEGLSVFEICTFTLKDIPDHKTCSLILKHNLSHKN